MIKFLTMSEVLLILEDQIRNYGGVYGTRDLNLLDSAKDEITKPDLIKFFEEHSLWSHVEKSEKKDLTFFELCYTLYIKSFVRLRA